MPPGYTFSDADVAAMLADTVERALAPREPAAGAATEMITLRTITDAFNRYVDQEVAALKALQEEATV